MKKISQVFMVILCSFFTISVQAQNWEEIKSMEGGNIFAFAVNENKIFVGAEGGVFLSTNNGTSWTAINNELTNPAVNALAVSGDYLFAGTYGSSVFRMHLSDIPIIHHPTTTDKRPLLRINTERGNMVVSYTMQSVGLVELNVYSISGKLIASLARGLRNAGNYFVVLEKGALPAGMYVVRFKTEKYQEYRAVLITK